MGLDIYTTAYYGIFLTNEQVENILTTNNILNREKLEGFICEDCEKEYEIYQKFCSECGEEVISKGEHSKPDILELFEEHFGKDITELSCDPVYSIDIEDNIGVVLGAQLEEHELCCGRGEKIDLSPEKYAKEILKVKETLKEIFKNWNFETRFIVINNSSS